LRAKLESARNQGAPVTELDDLVDLPETMTYIWLYFSDLHNARTSSGFGINPLQYSDIFAYFALYSIAPVDWEIRAIKKLDSIALSEYAEAARKEQEKAKSKAKSKK
jgi:hypothetical protein